MLDFFYYGIQLYALLSPYLCFISNLYLVLYVQGDDALSKGSFMRNKHLFDLFIYLYIVLRG